MPTLASLPGHRRQQVFWIPPPRQMQDPLAIVELARHAEVRGRAIEIDGGKKMPISHQREDRLALAGCVRNSFCKLDYSCDSFPVGEMSLGQ